MNILQFISEGIEPHLCKGRERRVTAAQSSFAVVVISDCNKHLEFLFLHRAFFKFIVYHINKCTVIYCTSLKFTLKTFESSYMFRFSDHLQGAYIVLS